MNVREMRTALPVVFPDIRIVDPAEQSRGFRSFNIILPNHWIINVGFGSSLKSSNRDRNFTDMESVSRVELSVVRPNQNHFSAWNLPPEEFPGEENGTLGFQTYEQLVRLIGRVAGYPRGVTK